MATAIIAYRESIPGGIRLKNYEELKVHLGLLLRPSPESPSPPQPPGAEPRRCVLPWQKVPYAGATLGKKKLSKWEEWLCVEEWACAGSVRIGAIPTPIQPQFVPFNPIRTPLLGFWNLEGLSDKSAVDKNPNFAPDTFLNCFVTTVIRHFDLVVLEELDTYNCNLLRERCIYLASIGLRYSLHCSLPLVVTLSLHSAHPRCWLLEVLWG